MKNNNLEFRASDFLFPFLQSLDKKNKNNPPEFNDLTVFESYNNNYGRGEFMPVKLGEYWFQIPPCVSIDMSKKLNIVQTNTMGFIEQIGSPDIIIRLRGHLVNEQANDYPSEELLNLKKLYKFEGSLPLIAKVPNIFGVTDVVFKSLTLEEVSKENVQTYSISLIPDYPLKAYIIREGS